MSTEITDADRAKAARHLNTHPMEVYRWLEGHVRFDRYGCWSDRRASAHQRLLSFVPPPAEKRATAYWRRSARKKIVAALDAADVFKVAYASG